MKHAIIILILIVISLGLGGNSSEVRDRVFTQSISIKKVNDIISTSIEIFGSDATYIGTGDNIQSCLDDAQLKQGKDLFTGHTELIVFQQDSFSLQILENLVKERVISPNCPVILSTIEDTNFQDALEILKSYDKLNRVKILTASDIIKNLRLANATEIPILNSDLSYNITTVNLYE